MEEKNIESAVVYTEEVKVENNVLEIKRTPETPLPEVETHDIKEVLARMEKNINARNQWQALIDQDQVILDKYNSNK